MRTGERLLEEKVGCHGITPRSYQRGKHANSVPLASIELVFGHCHLGERHFVALE